MFRKTEGILRERITKDNKSIQKKESIQLEDVKKLDSIQYTTCHPKQDKCNDVSSYYESEEWNLFGGALVKNSNEIVSRKRKHSSLELSSLKKDNDI
jgi:hypothetical protein